MIDDDVNCYGRSHLRGGTRYRFAHSRRRPIVRFADQDQERDVEYVGHATIGVKHNCRAETTDATRIVLRGSRVRPRCAERRPSTMRPTDDRYPIGVGKWVGLQKCQGSIGIAGLAVKVGQFGVPIDTARTERIDDERQIAQGAESSGPHVVMFPYPAPAV